MKPNTHWLDIPDAAKMLGISVKTLRRRAAEGCLQLVEFRGKMYAHRFVLRESVERFLRENSNGNEASDERTRSDG